MQRYDIHDSITSLFIWGLRWTDTKKSPDYIGIGNREINAGIEQAIQEQNKIGWNNVRRGFISVWWAETQYKVDKQQKRESKQWNKLFVTWITNVSWEMWKLRNEELHGQNVKEGREKKLQHYQSLVSILYKQAHKVACLMDNDVTQLFKLSEERQKKKGVVALETWTGLAEKVLAQAEEKLQKIQENGLDKWLNRELTYQAIKPGGNDKLSKLKETKTNKNKQKKIKHFINCIQSTGWKVFSLVVREEDSVGN